MVWCKVHISLKKISKDYDLVIVNICDLPNNDIWFSNPERKNTNFYQLQNI